jgi:hypothetical protein
MAKKRASTPDTSVVVAGLCSWHPDHHAARLALAKHPPIVAHVLAESYSVLTRLPAQQRVQPTVARRALAAAFPNEPVQLAANDMNWMLDVLAGNNVGGGATYDALVASTALRAGFTLQSLDLRALPTYSVVGVEVDWLGGPASVDA